jgi:phage terminase large subunit-like protein
VLERRKEIAEKLRDLAAAGELVLVETVGDDVEELADAVEQLYAAGLFSREDDTEESIIPAIGVDPAGIGGVVETIVGRGVPQKKIIGISQGWRLNGAIKTSERWLAGDRIRHGGMG